MHHKHQEVYRIMKKEFESKLSDNVSMNIHSHTKIPLLKSLHRLANHIEIQMNIEKDTVNKEFYLNITNSINKGVY